ncbi:hypothetical protein AQUCO_01200113v1 [Aquilegia coerulea]|uniref:FBD domain-containing protein n=1 Tax=Aquilegia coerulea TaxID=218851 RepID=A0A2G5E4K2_AQUCA|nr:hypothetical protein AQUCO_01200113v1 [Aquilegia coerulea]
MWTPSSTRYKQGTKIKFQISDMQRNKQFINILQIKGAQSNNTGLRNLQATRTSGNAKNYKGSLSIIIIRRPLVVHFYCIFFHFRFQIYSIIIRVIIIRIQHYWICLNSGYLISISCCILNYIILNHSNLISFLIPLRCYIPILLYVYKGTILLLKLLTLFIIPTKYSRSGSALITSPQDISSIEIPVITQVLKTVTGHCPHPSIKSNPVFTSYIFWWRWETIKEDILHPLTRTSNKLTHSSQVSTCPSAHEQLPSLFRNLRHLKLHGCCGNAVANLLKFTPHIETLFWKTAAKEDITAFYGGQFPLNCVLCELKYVEVHNLQGCEDELKLLEFIMKNASVLKTVDITAGAGVKELTEFRNKLQSLSRAS